MVARDEAGARLLEVSRSTLSVRPLSSPASRRPAAEQRHRQPRRGVRARRRRPARPRGPGRRARPRRPAVPRPARARRRRRMVAPSSPPAWPGVQPGLGRPGHRRLHRRDRHKDDLGRLWTVKSDGWDPLAVLDDSVSIGDIGNQLTVDPAGSAFVVPARSSTGISLWMVNRGREVGQLPHRPEHQPRRRPQLRQPLTPSLAGRRRRRGLWTGSGDGRAPRLACRHVPAHRDGPAAAAPRVPGLRLRRTAGCCAACLPPEPGEVGPWPLAADPEVAVWALGAYGDGLRAAVLAGKLDGQAAALAELGRRLGVALATAGIGADLVTWSPPGGSPACPGTTPSGSPPASPPRSTSPWPACSPRPAAATWARPAGTTGCAAPGGRRPARPRPAATWPAAGSCSWTTWPPPAARTLPAPPRLSASPALSGSGGRAGLRPGRPPGRRGGARRRWPGSRVRYDRDLPCSHRSHCVVVTCFRV